MSNQKTAESQISQLLRHKEEDLILKEIGKISCELLHDLISPINGLTLYLDTFGSRDIKKLIIPVNETSDNIRNFIDVVQQATKNPHKVEVVNVKKVVSNVASILRHKAISKDIRIVIAQDTKNVLILSNKLKIYQIIISLINNSIEAFENVKNRPIQTVTISISRDKKGLGITVADNATGIETELLDRIFEKNFTTKDAGFGLGLPNVKEIVENDLGGKVGIQSKIGKGTKFKIYISSKYLISHQ